MTFKLSFHREARKEARDALLFYREIDPALAAEFLEIYESAIAQILAVPLGCAVVIGQARSKVLRKYPYTIFYRFDTSEVRIIAVAHQKRRPEYWLNRT